MEEEPGRLQSMGSRRVGHDWVTSLSLFSCMYQRRKWQPTPVFLPGESQRREPGGLPSMGLHRVGHAWCDLAAAAAGIQEPSPQFLPGESQEWGAWWASIYGVAQNQTQLKRLSSGSSRYPGDMFWLILVDNHWNPSTLLLTTRWQCAQINNCICQAILQIHVPSEL